MSLRPLSLERHCCRARRHHQVQPQSKEENLRMTTTTPPSSPKFGTTRHVLRDQGISYGDYVEQITFLLFPR